MAYDEWGSSDLYGNAPDEEQWQSPTQSYDTSDSFAPTNLDQYDYLGSQYQGQNQPNQSWESNISNIPMEGWGQNGTDWGSIDQQIGTSFNSPMQNLYDSSQGGLMGMFSKGLDGFNKGLGTVGNMQNVLGGGGNQNTNTMLKSLAGLWAAQQDKKAQSQYGQQTQQAAQQMQQNTNPFSAERARYQQELAAVQDRLNQFRSNPNANTQYKTLQDQLIMQANRGSRQRGTSDVQMAAALAPELTKAQMSIENQMLGDRKDLYTPAGANLNGSSGILEAMLAGNKATATADSNASYASVIGKLLQGDTNQNSQNLSSAEVEKLRAILGQR